jgi:hypothetical protein
MPSKNPKRSGGFVVKVQRLPGPFRAWLLALALPAEAFAQGAGSWGGASGMAAAVLLAILGLVALVAFGVARVKGLLVLAGLIVLAMAASQVARLIDKHERAASAREAATRCLTSAGERHLEAASSTGETVIWIAPSFKNVNSRHIPDFSWKPTGERIELVQHKPTPHPASQKTLVSIELLDDPGHSNNPRTRGYRISVSRLSDGKLLSERIDYELRHRLCLVDGARLATERFLRKALGRDSVFMPADTRGPVNATTLAVVGQLSKYESGVFSRIASADRGAKYSHEQGGAALLPARSGCRPDRDGLRGTRVRCAEAMPEENTIDLANLAAVAADDTGWFAFLKVHPAAEEPSAFVMEKRDVYGRILRRWVVNMPLAPGAHPVWFADPKVTPSSGQVDLLMDRRSTRSGTAAADTFEGRIRVRFPLSIEAAAK